MPCICHEHDAELLERLVGVGCPVPRRTGPDSGRVRDFPVFSRPGIVFESHLGHSKTPSAVGAGDGVFAFAVHHGRMIPSRMTGDLLAGMWELIGSWVRCAAADLGQRNRHRPTEQLRRRRRAFAGVLATRIVQVKPYDPESKGV